MTNVSPKTRPTAVLDRQIDPMPLYKVLLHNDEVNIMEHVVKALMKVFRFEQQECEQIMIEAHRNGLSLCIVEPLEQAEFHQDKLRSYSLVTTIEPE